MFIVHISQALRYVHRSHKPPFHIHVSYAHISRRECVAIFDVRTQAIYINNNNSDITNGRLKVHK